jgi:simple sugar transport system permease protein
MATPAFAGAAVQAAVPLCLLVLGALLCQRAGLVNLGLEGMLLAGACVGAAMAPRLGPGPAIAFGVAAGVWLALLHALATVQFGVDQVVSGLALNVLAFGAARPLATVAFGPSGVSRELGHLPLVPIPWLGGVSPLAPLALLTGLAVLLALRFGVAGPLLFPIVVRHGVGSAAGIGWSRALVLAITAGACWSMRDEPRP